MHINDRYALSKYNKMTQYTIRIYTVDLAILPAVSRPAIRLTAAQT